MEISVQSIKFDADQKLLDFIDKKLSKLSKFYEETERLEVTLSLLPDHENKNVKIRAAIPGDDIIVERKSDKFENAIVECAGILKELLVAAKEKKYRSLN
ncbi:MAG: HPF/RaiA family ribosome-associated protein [Bacteroidales bacterium]|nr:HPF/RaiA family ribosome-associated protein [Bacteroidales bacterium]